jgi:hypothetical protein
MPTEEQGKFKNRRRKLLERAYSKLRFYLEWNCQERGGRDE